MYCCFNCFSDPGLRKRIIATSSKSGNCNFCQTKNIEIIRCEDLSEIFDPIFDLYDNNPNAEKSLKITKPILLWEHLDMFWPNLFNKRILDQKMILPLVDQIGKGYWQYSTALFEEPVEFVYLIDSRAIDEEDLQLKWDFFANDIKRNNRFFLDQKIDTELLQSIFERLSFTYPRGMEFYRARISESHLPLNELGKPPFQYATPGRANPIGIPYLYVSNSEKTTLYETRVSLHESVTIGKFLLKAPLSLVSLKNIAEYGPFEIMDKDFDIDGFIRYRPYLQKLETELSKPVRKQDVHLDYLPTQFLCEFIKSLGFDAVEYKSAMNSDGFNLAIFNDDKLDCVDSKFYNVTNLEYKWA